MKRFILCVGFLLVAAGCTSSGPIKTIIRDQQFTGYKDTLDQLEKDYLQKKITYAQYLDKKKSVEEDYQKKIDTRRDLIQNQTEPGASTEMLK